MKKKKDNHTPSLGAEVSLALGLPADTLANLPHITLCGNLNIYIENFINIIEYTDSLISINTKKFPVMIKGENLEIAFISKGEINIDGIIKSIEFVL